MIVDWGEDSWFSSIITPIPDREEAFANGQPVLSSPTLMPAAPPPPDPEWSVPSFTPFTSLLAQPAIVPMTSEAADLLARHGVSNDDDWIWRANTYDPQTLAQQLGQLAPSVAEARMLDAAGVGGDSDWIWRASTYDESDLSRLLESRSSLVVAPVERLNDRSLPVLRSLSDMVARPGATGTPGASPAIPSVLLLAALGALLFID